MLRIAHANWIETAGELWPPALRLNLSTVLDRRERVPSRIFRSAAGTFVGDKST
jgi:hypothetical protein